MNNPLLTSTIIRTTTNRLLVSYENRATAEQNAWWLLAHITQKSLTQLRTSTEYISAAQHAELQKALHRIVDTHEPIQYVIGSVPFHNLILSVQAPLLIPRPETEMWVATLIEEYRIAQQKPPRILDLCTGTGCIALTLAAAFPQSTIYATDIHPDAITVAQKNAKTNGIAHAHFFLSDLAEAVRNDGPYDLIVANPPYIPEHMWKTLDPSVRCWEDPRALVAPENGLALIKRIIHDAKQLLRPTTHKKIATLWIEIDETQHQDVLLLLSETGFSNIRILKDYLGKPRVVCASI